MELTEYIPILEISTVDDRLVYGTVSKSEFFYLLSINDIDKILNFSQLNSDILYRICIVEGPCRYPISGGTYRVKTITDIENLKRNLRSGYRKYIKFRNMENC